MALYAVGTCIVELKYGDGITEVAQTNPMCSPEPFLLHAG